MAHQVDIVSIKPFCFTIPPQSTNAGSSSPMEATEKEPMLPAMTTGINQDEVEQHGAQNRTYTQQQILPPDVNGQSSDVPLDQVYINNGMHPSTVLGSLESHFQALNMNGQKESPYDFEDHASEPTDNDDDEGEDDPVKLFVGQVSKPQAGVYRNLLMK